MFQRWHVIAQWVSSAVGHNFRNFWKSHSDRESAKEFKLPGMCSALIRMLNFKQANTSFLIRDITLGDLDDFLLMIDTTAWLSIWNKKILFLKDSPQIFKAMTTGINSRKVMSVKIPDEIHELDQHAWAHFRSWQIPKPFPFRPALSENRFNS